MFRILRLIFRVAVLMLFALILIALFTNPTLEDFGNKVKEQLNGEIGEQTNNPSLSYIAELGTEFTDQIVKKMVQRKNYFVCSVFIIELPDGEYYYLGAFTMFYPLQDKNPLDVIIVNNKK